MKDATPTFLNLPEDKQRRVLDVAAEEFAAHGFAGASVNRMVGALGIAKGSIFKYFGTKEGIFRCVFGQAVSVLKARLKAVRAETEEASFFERIERSLVAGIAFIDAHPVIYRMYLKMLFQENAPMREAFLREVRGYAAKYLRPLVQEGVARGELRADLDVDAAVFLLDTLLDRVLQAHAVPNMDGLGLHGADGKETARRVASLVATLRLGMGAQAGKAGRIEGRTKE